MMLPFFDGDFVDKRISLTYTSFKQGIPKGGMIVTGEKEAVSQDLLVRLRRIEGQVRGLQRMIDEETECEQILNQVAAVRSALNRVGMIIFRYHSRECIFKAVDSGQVESIDEIVTLLGRLIK